MSKKKTWPNWWRRQLCLGPQPIAPLQKKLVTCLRDHFQFVSFRIASTNTLKTEQFMLSVYTETDWKSLDKVVLTKKPSFFTKLGLHIASLKQQSRMHIHIRERCYWTVLLSNKQELAVRIKPRATLNGISRSNIDTCPVAFSNGAGAHFTSNQQKLDDTLLVRWAYNYFYLSRGAFRQFDNECLTSPPSSPKEKDKFIESIENGCMSIFCFWLLPVW